MMKRSLPLNSLRASFVAKIPAHGSPRTRPNQHRPRGPSENLLLSFWWGRFQKISYCPTLWHPKSRLVESAARSSFTRVILIQITTKP